MKTKQLLTYLNTNNLVYLLRLRQLELSDLKFKQVFNYYDGNLDGVVEVDNKDYYYTFTDTDRGDNRVFIVLDTNNYNVSGWKELFNKDLDIIGYFKN